MRFKLFKSLQFLIFVSILLLSLIPETRPVNSDHRPVIASPSTIWVPDNYTKIQWAIGNASAGDTIFVREGIYYEHISINKNNLTLVGENKSTTIIDGNETGAAVTVTANNVTISGFTIQKGDVGFFLSHSNYTIVSGNIIKGWSQPSLRQMSGIDLIYSSGNLISNNLISDCTRHGIYVEQHGNNTIINNTITTNADVQLLSMFGTFGISIYQSDDNNLTCNTVSNTCIGISIRASERGILRVNNMDGNIFNFQISGGPLSEYIHNIDASNLVDGKPIYYWINQCNKQVPTDTGYVAVINSTEIIMKDLNITNNFEGVTLKYTTNSLIENVSLLNNYESISLSSSSQNTINCNIIVFYPEHFQSVHSLPIGISTHGNNNTIIGNTISVVTAWNEPAITLSMSGRNNTVFHNNFYNPDVYDWEENGTIWDNGTEGNYWSDYNGTDTNGDGIGDTNLPWQGVDYYPLMNPRRLCQFSHPETMPIYQVHLKMNTYFTSGSDLVVKFYTYGGLYQGNITFWNGTTPAHVLLSKNVSHPLNMPIENATLIITNKSGDIISTVLSFVMGRSMLMERISEIDTQWTYVSSEERKTLFSEIVDIDFQWVYATP